jgi:multidrug efflux pump subunit AcrB
VLPAHLGHGLSASGDRLSNPVSRAWKRIQGGVADGLETFIHQRYRPALTAALEWRYLTVATSVSVLLLCLGLVVSGHMKFTFFPRVEGDNVIALLSMPQGTPVEVTAQAMQRIEGAAERLRTEIEAEHGTLVRHVLATVGEQPFRSGGAHGPPGMGSGSASGSHLAEVNLELIPAEEREITSPEIERRWRRLVGRIPDAEELMFVSSLFDPGEPINIELQGPDVATLRWASGAVKRKLADYPGVYDVADSFRGGKQELKLEILPAAESLGLTLADLARQVRQAFYGEEAQRIQRGRDDVRVMVRYPRDERRSVGDLENMRIRTPAGGEVPFPSVARGDWGRGFSTIRRADKQRIINVTANVDPARANANEILADLRATLLPAIRAEHPEIH